MIDCIKNSIKSILRKKFRSLLTITGIGIGVISVVIISTIGSVGKQAINTEINSTGLGGITISSNIAYPNVQLSSEELDIISNQKGVESATPVIIEYTKSIVRSKSENSLLWGIDNNAKDIVSLSVINGRMFNKSDISSSPNVCIVDESYALSTYKRTNIVGKKIEILINNSYKEFEIIGVVASGGNILQNLIGNYIPNFIYVPFTTLQRISGKSTFDQIILKLDNTIEPETIVSNITSTLENYNGVKGSIKAQNLVKQKEQLNNMLSIITLILSSIASISLIVSGLSIMTVMLFSVKERTREIGIKKSIGASKFIILFEFMIEALMISLIGTFIGILSGILISYIGCYMISYPFNIDINLIIFCGIFAISTGLIFGSYPAFKAAKLKPVDALRIES